MLNPLLVKTAVKELPETLAAVRFQFREDYPSEPMPLDEEVMAALNLAFQFTIDVIPKPDDPVL